MYLRRHCYDKPWRCPGWAGGGWRYAKKERCDGGSLDFRLTSDGGWPRFHAWHWHRCSKCDIRAIPMALRWLDPTWLWHRWTR